MKSATKRQLELILKLKAKVGLPPGDLWSLTEQQAFNIIQLLRNYAKSF